MNKIYLVFISLFLLGQSGWTQDSLVVISYNIQGQRPDTNPEIRIQYIIDQLNNLNPDIIGIQEINEDIKLSGEDNQGQIIADSLSTHFNTTYYFYQGFTHLSWEAQFREFIGIISKYPVEQADFLALPKGTFNRKVIWNYINTPLGKVNFFNTHLSFNSEDARIRQVEAMLPYIESQTNVHPGVATIMTGDFNATPNSEPIRYFTHTGSDTFFFDSYREINPFSPGYTVPANNPESKIDYVLYGSTGNLEISSSKIVMDTTYNGTDHISDHLGVLTVFKKPLNNSRLRFTPYLEFGETRVWTKNDTILTLSNPGTESAVISAISSSNPVFSANPTNVTIPAGGSAELTVSFFPDAGITYKGIISMMNDVGRERFVYLSGKGLTLTFTKMIDFGSVLVENPQDSVIIIFNPTNADILVSGIVSSGLEFSANPLTFTIPPQSDYPLTVTFTPQNPGLIEGTLTLLSNAGETSLSLLGIGLEASSWKIQDSGVIDDLLNVYMADSLTGWATGNNGRILKTVNAGENWELQSSGTFSSLRSVYFVDATNGWVVGNNGTILKTTTGGQMWTPDTSGTIAILTSVYFISPSVGWTAGTNGIILKTENGGNKWQIKSSAGIMTFTCIYFIDSQTGWVAGTRGLIRKTTDGGNSWNTQISNTDEDLWSIRFKDSNNGWIVGENGTLLHTIDGGETWIPQELSVHADLSGLYLGSQNTYWAVGDKGTILKTSDAGQNWIPQYSGSKNKLNAISFGSPLTGIIAGSGGLIINTTYGGIVNLERQKLPDDSVPSNFYLSQNYPNPFNPTTVISYELPVTSYITLSIYNLLGQKVAILVSEKQLAGLHNVSWDASNYPSGVYYYRLSTDAGFFQTKKLVLLK